MYSVSQQPNSVRSRSQTPNLSKLSSATAEGADWRVKGRSSRWLPDSYVGNVRVSNVG